MKNRRIKEVIQKVSGRPLGRLILLTGARQTGKTTLLKAILPEYAYISFDDPVMRAQFASLSAEDLALRFPRAILDEVQKMPSMFETVKAAHDAHEECRYVLSGSSQILLMEHISETLAGRVSIFELDPLTLPECSTISWDGQIQESRWQRLLADPCGAKDILWGMPALDPQFAAATLTWEKYLRFGGMPAVWNDELGMDDKERRKWLTDYARTYLQRDVRDLVRLKDLEPFVLAQKSLALQTGGLVSFANIARDAMIAPSTATRFMQYLERSYQIVLLRPWFANRKKRLVKSPKLHFSDPGVLRTIAGYEGTLPGNAFESAVVAEMLKQLHVAGANAEAYHLRTADGLEVDLLISTPAGYVAVEIKQSSAVSRHDARHLMALDGILDKPVACRLVVAQSKSVESLGGNAFAVPAPWLLG